MRLPDCFSSHRVALIGAMKNRLGGSLICVSINLFMLAHLWHQPWRCEELQNSVVYAKIWYQFAFLCKPPQSGLKFSWVSSMSCFSTTQRSVNEPLTLELDRGRTKTHFTPFSLYEIKRIMSRRKKTLSHLGRREHKKWLRSRIVKNISRLSEDFCYLFDGWNSWKKVGVSLNHFSFADSGQWQ